MIPKKRKVDSQDETSFPTTTQSQSSTYPVQQSQSSTYPIQQSQSSTYPVQQSQSSTQPPPIPSSAHPTTPPIPSSTHPTIPPTPIPFSTSFAPNLNTILNHLEHHINNDHSMTLTALRNRFGLLTNDLLNDGVDAMMNVLFLNTSRRSRSVTPSSSILQEDLYFTSLDDWSYLPPLSAEPRDDYEFELHKDEYPDSLISGIFHCSSNEKFPKSRSLDILIDGNEEFPKWVAELFRNELHALFIRCRNLDDAKSNAIIKKFLKILVPEIGEQIFDDAASKFRSTFIEWRHILWTKINKLFTNLQTRAK
ncbi:hypothetical protein F8M41_012054, partial [Gigaspora margarita]